LLAYSVISCIDGSLLLKPRCMPVVFEFWQKSTILTLSQLYYSWCATRAGGWTLEG
jgi:hypothetical protein